MRIRTMKNLSRVVLLLAVAISGCGRSPLLHHVDAADDRPPEGNGKEVPPASYDAMLSVSRLCVNVEWTASPKSGVESVFILSFREQGDGVALKEPSGELSIQLWMPIMGHGSSPVETAPIAAG